MLDCMPQIRYLGEKKDSSITTSRYIKKNYILFCLYTTLISLLVQACENELHYGEGVMAVLKNEAQIHNQFDREKKNIFFSKIEICPRVTVRC